MKPTYLLKHFYAHKLTKNTYNPHKLCYQGGTIRTQRKIISTSECNYEVDSISHHKESTTLQYLMYITMRYKKMDL